MLDERSLARTASVFPELESLPADLEAVMRRDARNVDFPAGATVFDSGAPCLAFLLVLEGGLRVTRTSPEGREILLYPIRPGDTCVMTLACLLGHRNYAGRGTVTDALRAVALPKPLFEEFIARLPAFRRRLFASVADRLADLGALVEEVAFRRLDRRLASLLLRRGTGTAVLALTHQDLADELGSVREIVSRLLESFESRGAVRLERKQVTLLDRAILESIAGER